ncbi:hypothetical protein ABK040_001668 [Willaertia magna]
MSSNVSFPFDTLLHCVQLKKELLSLTIDTTINYYKNIYNNALSQLLLFNNNHHSIIEDNDSKKEWNYFILELQKENVTIDEINNLFLRIKKFMSQHLLQQVVDRIPNEKCQQPMSTNNFIITTKYLSNHLEQTMKQLSTQLIQHSMFYGIPLEMMNGDHQTSPCQKSNNNIKQKNNVFMTDENLILLSCIYCCCILHDEQLQFTIENIQKLLKASNINIPDIYCQIVIKYFNKKPLQNALELNYTTNLINNNNNDNDDNKSVSSVRSMECYGISDEELFNIFD